MEITTDHKDGISIISVSGELDAISSRDLAEVFKDELEEGYVNFVYDLKNLQYSSSAGIRIFLGSARESRQKGGDLRIGSVLPQVRKIFDLSKFDKVVKVFETSEEAINSFTQTQPL